MANGQAYRSNGKSNIEEGIQPMVTNRLHVFEKN
jgi:hypothetical protein